jgi:thiol-disulfide isomerase/thioredoxin
VTAGLAGSLSGLVLAFGLAVHGGTAPTLEGVLPRAGEPAPALHLNDMNGRPYDLSDSRGRWVFVHFWASWCPPCRREMPGIARMSEKLKAASLRIVLVNTAEDEDTIFLFLGSVAPGLSTLLDLDGSATERWEPRGLPATYLVDPAGRIRYQALGGRPWDEPAYLEFLRALSHSASDRPLPTP